MQRRESGAGGYTEPPALVQRQDSRLKAFGNRLAGTDAAIAARVKGQGPAVDSDAVKYLHLIAQGQAAEAAGVPFEQAYAQVPERYRPARHTASEKTVAANKRDFLEEAVQESAKEQRKKGATQQLRTEKAMIGVKLKMGSATEADKERLAAIADPEKAAKKQHKASLALSGEASDWQEKIYDENADKAAAGIGAAGAATGAAGGVELVMGEAAHYVGNVAIGGETNARPQGATGLATGSAGTAGEGLGVTYAAGDLAGLAQTAARLASSIKAYMSGNAAEKATAQAEIIDAVVSLANTLITLAGDALKVAWDFGGTVVQSEVGTAIPILGAVGSATQLGKDIYDLQEAAKRLSGEAERIKEALAADREDLAFAIEQLKNRGTTLVATTTVSAVANALQVAGHAITASGVGAVVGQPIVVAGTALKAANKAALALVDSYQAGKAQEARAMDALGQLGAAEELMKHDPKHGLQALIREAKQGNAIAKQELKAYGVTDTMLAGAGDASIRKFVLSALKLKEGNKTLGQKLRDTARTAKEWWNTDTRKQIATVAKAKNALNYGGRSDRGFFWKLKAISGYDTDSMENVHRALVELQKPENIEKRRQLKLGDRELEQLIRDTRSQFERQRDTGNQPAISGPLHLAGVPFMPPPARPGEQGADGLDDLRLAAAGVDVSQIPGGPEPEQDGPDDLPDWVHSLPSVPDWIDRLPPVPNRRVAAAQIPEGPEPERDMLGDLGASPTRVAMLE